MYKMICEVNEEVRMKLMEPFIQEIINRNEDEWYYVDSIEVDGDDVIITDNKEEEEEEEWKYTFVGGRKFIDDDVVELILYETVSPIIYNDDCIGFKVQSEDDNVIYLFHNHSTIQL